MNDTKTFINNPLRFAGRDWYYPFRKVPSQLNEKSCQKVSVRLLERYSVLTKNWSKELNSEWMTRHYVASKLIMGATLNIGSAIFAEQKNLRVVIPYLRYYAALSLLRAICYTLPDVEWDDGKLISISHSAAKRIALEYLGKIDSTISKNSERLIVELKADRELLSYRAPSSGDDQISEKHSFLSLCTLLAEIAQFNSELLGASVLKYTQQSTHTLLPDYASKIASIEIENQCYSDREDAYRLDYLARKQSFPTNILFLMTDGHVDDFFGAWCTEDEENEDKYNPDEYQQIIFDIP